jgi:CAAX protease family protein
VRSLGLLALVGGLLLLASIASPWATWAVTALVGRPFTFGRVYNRVFEALLVVTLPLAWRRLDLGNAAAMGFGRAGRGRTLRRGLAVGLAGIVSAVVVCAALRAASPALRFEQPAKMARKVALGTVAAAVVGTAEEALFRGVVLRRLTIDFGVATGVAVTTAIYAAVHAIGKGGAEPNVDAWAGFRRTAALFAPVAEPQSVPALVGLSVFGLLLATARLRSGTLWLPIGIHASWVAMFRVGRLFVAIHPTPTWLVGAGWPPLIGGAAGWLAVAVSAFVLLATERRAARV